MARWTHLLLWAMFVTVELSPVMSAALIGDAEPPESHEAPAVQPVTS